MFFKGQTTKLLFKKQGLFMREMLHQFIEQYDTAFTLCTNSSNNNLLILEIKPLE